MRSDIANYLEGQGVDLKYSGENVGPNDVAMGCPWCDDPSYHLTIHRRKGYLNCWRCEFSEYKIKHPKGFSPSFRSLIQLLEKCSWQTAKQRWSEITGEDLEDDSPAPVEEKPEAPTECRLPECTLPFGDPGPYKKVRDVAYQYLRGRRFTRYHIEKYHLHFCYNGFYSGRVILPIYKAGVLVNWLGRRFVESIPFRYRNCPSGQCLVRMSELLYGIEEWEDGPLRIVEGAFDKMRIGPSAIPLNRSKLSSSQRSTIIKLSPHIEYASIILDPEAAANAYSIAEDLNAIIDRIKVIRLPLGKDPAEMELGDLLRIESQTPFFAF